MNIFKTVAKSAMPIRYFPKGENKIRFQEKVFMRINTMDMVQDMYLDTDATLNPDYSLSGIFSKHHPVSSNSRLREQSTAIRCL
ncbi:MAG: hypothetical protein HC887_03090 [Desulfobacteraceae bacterium]|nr:hypothetical protein [Desulfobacteraceae bacterium]